jgi:hypothetical protein
MSRVMPNQYKVAVIKELDDLRGLGQEWNEIAPPKEVEPWQSFSWVEAAATAGSQNQSLRVITIRKNGQLVAIAPLVLKSFAQPFHPTHLEFLGGEEIKEPNRLISLEPAALELLIDTILSERVYPIRLSRIPNDPKHVRSIITKFRKSRRVTLVMSMPYPYLELAKNNPIKKSLREDLKRARKKAKMHGEVKAEVLRPATQEELQRRVECAFQIEGSGWKGRNNTAIVSNDYRRKFFERYAFSAWKDGTLRLSFLEINGTVVAEQYAIESAKSYWLLNIGYNEEYHHCSPGNLLLEESIRYATRNGLLRYHFLGKVEPWTTRGTKSSQDCLILAAYRPNWYGTKAICSDFAYLVDKRVKEHKMKRRNSRK